MDRPPFGRGIEIVFPYLLEIKDDLLLDRPSLPEVLLVPVAQVRVIKEPEPPYRRQVVDAEYFPAGRVQFNEPALDIVDFNADGRAFVNSPELLNAYFRIFRYFSPEHGTSLLQAWFEEFTTIGQLLQGL